jgi:hypothetical protein
MKTPSLFAGPAQPPQAPATQAAREQTSGKELAAAQTLRLGCTRSVADLLIQATSLKTDEQDS